MRRNAVTLLLKAVAILYVLLIFTAAFTAWLRQ